MSSVEYQFLLTTSYFSNCSITEIARFYSHLEILSVNAGTYLFQQGEIENSWFLIRRGSVLVKRKGRSGIEYTLAELGAGEGFGEMGLLESSSRLASAEAVDATVLYRLKGNVFLSLLEEQDPIARRMLLAMAITQSQRLREMTITLQDITELDHLGEYTPMPNPLDVTSLLTASLFLR